MKMLVPLVMLLAASPALADDKLNWAPAVTHGAAAVSNPFKCVL